MATLRHFTELQVWQKARTLCVDIQPVATRAKSEGYHSFQNQVLRSAGSIMDNIAEGFEREGNKEFIHFLSIAKGSCGELQSQLYRAYDLGWATEGELNNLLERCKEISRMISGLQTHLKSSEHSGNKFSKSEKPDK